MVISKKGFTLTELIAVIVVLSLLISISTVVFINVRKNVLKKAYEDLVLYLETKAEEYADNTGIIVINVEDLIKEGYVTPDDGKAIYNPETKESMNCYIIKSSFVEGRYKAKLSENLGVSNDGTCNTYTRVSDIEICRFDGDTCKSIGDNEWFNKDVTLGVKYRNAVLSGDNVTYDWSSTNGFTSNEATVKTSTELVSHNMYKCEVVFGNVHGEASKSIAIDKQKPKIISVSFDKEWSSEKTVTIEATDMNGSGIKGYGFNSDTCEKYQTSNSFKVIISGTYKICVIDNAGNVETDSVKVDNINFKPEKPTITADDNVESGKWHKGKFVLSFYSYVGEELGPAVYYYGTSENDLNNTGGSVTVTQNGLTYYVKACNNTGLCSDISSYVVKIDSAKPNAPSFTASDGITSNNWHKGEFTLSIGGSSASSGIKYYYSLNANNVDTEYVGNISVKDETNGTTYYAKACNGVGVCSDVVSYIAKLDKTTSIKAPTITASDGILSGNWHRTNFTLHFSGSSSTSGVTYYYGIRTSSMYSTGTSTSITSETSGTTYYVKACNAAGLCSSVSSYIVRLDKATSIKAPTITASDGILSDRWHKSNFTLTFSGSTSTSGVTYYYGTRTNSMTSTGTSTSITSETSGTTYYVKACNAFNVCSSTSSYIAKLDKASPIAPNVTMYKARYYGDSYTKNTWTSDNVYIILSYSRTDVSGIAKYQYSYDNYRWTDMSNDRMYISSGGTTNIYFRAVDGAGNTGTASSKYTIKIDNDIPVAPTVSLTYYKKYSNLTYKEKTWVNGEIKASLSYSRTDSSGIAKYQYSYNNSSWSDISGTSFTNTKEGKITVYFRAVDNAGNVGKATSAYNLYYDKTAPGRIYTVNVRKGSATGYSYSSGSWSPEPLYAIPNYSGYDESGIAGFMFSLDNRYWYGPYPNYKVDKVGNNTMYIKAIDNAGNEGPVYTLNNLKISKYLADYSIGAYINYNSKIWRLVSKSGSGSTGRATLVSADCIGSGATLTPKDKSSVDRVNGKIDTIAKGYKNYNMVYSASPIKENDVATYSRIGGTVKCNYFAYPSQAYASYATYVRYGNSRGTNYTKDHVDRILTSSLTGGTRVVLVMNSGVYTTTTNDGGSQYYALTITK